MLAITCMVIGRLAPQSLTVATPATRTSCQGPARPTTQGHDCWIPRPVLGGEPKVSNGEISVKNTVIGRVDEGGQYSLEVGGQKVTGNVLELLLAAVLARVLEQAQANTSLEQTKPGDTVNAGGRQYVAADPSSGAMPTVSGSQHRTQTHPQGGVHGRQNSPEDLDQLPIWSSDWSEKTTAEWKDRMSVDRTPIAGKLAALEKFKAFQRETYGSGGNYDRGYQSGSIQNLFISGAIYNPRFYELGTQQKNFISDQYQKLLGREPTMHELQKWTYMSANMSVNESEFAKLQEKFSTLKPDDLEAVAKELGSNLGLKDSDRALSDKYTDRTVTDGVKAYLKEHPGATEADVRKVAKEQYGINDAQLNRVKNNFFTEPATKPSTGGKTSRYNDHEVLDGVKAYLKDHPGASETEIRSVAKSQYGLADDQLDRVKEQFIAGA